jgi:hypothetical protein
VREEIVEPIISETPFGDVEHTDVVSERAGESLDKAGFAASGGTVEEVAPSVWNA